MTLNQISRKSIERQTGLSLNQIVNMDVEELDKAIERKIGKNYLFLKSMIRVYPVGVPYI